MSPRTGTRLLEVEQGQDPDIRFGKPCLTGTRIDVATIVWRTAVPAFARTPRVERLFELMDDGVMVPWRDIT